MSAERIPGDSDFVDSVISHFVKFGLWQGFYGCDKIAIKQTNFMIRMT